MTSALRGMLVSLSLMHATLTSLRPGEAAQLIAPLLKPLNRVESRVAHSLRGLAQRLRAGAGAVGAAANTAPPALGTASSLKLFDDCYAECLRAIVLANRRVLSGIEGGAGAASPSLANNEVLTFNALVYSIKSLSHHMEACYDRLEALLALQRPIDLRAVSFV